MNSLVERAQAVLRANDHGGYTVPSARLYPFQWNWDSGFVALGWATFDEARAWLELESLVGAQWDDGMIPHIVFHKASTGYSPGPEVWGTEGRRPPTSGISQPPVLATVVRRLLEEARDRGLAEAKAEALTPALLSWHRWWRGARDPEGSGLVVIHHPWESGRDNSPDWDAALARVPTTRNRYERRDLALIDADQRPHQHEYDRYLYLVDLFRDLDYDSDRLSRDCPFRVVDVGTNAILHRADLDLIALAEKFGHEVEARELASRAARTRHAFADLWHPEHGLYLSFDRRAGAPIEVPSAAGFLALFGRIPGPDMAATLAETAARWTERTRFALPTMQPDHDLFEPRRYWRGPVWAHFNWLIAEGFAAYGHNAIADRLRVDMRRLIEAGGFFEYYDPRDGTGCGGGEFSWTAATALFWAVS